MDPKNKNLVIVESPAKARTIEKFLGKDFKVVASYGHVRDLPKNSLGVDVVHGFKPTYIIPKEAKPYVEALKKEAKDIKDLYLATDFDREGEAIAFHVVEILKPQLLNITPKRITFHEITRKAIEEALKHPRNIDMNLVSAQQARRILDRLVGYTLSPLLWKKVKRGLSAGRVQSVALRLIVEREKEIEKFVPKEFWKIIAILKKQNENKEFKAELIQKNEKKLEIKNKKEAEEILEAIKESEYQVKGINKKELVKNPPPPFITSTLQQTAFRELGFTAKKTMFIAQTLYEGVDLPEGRVGIITYMRTDSLNVAEEAIKEVRELIKEKLGEKYLPETPFKYKTKVKGAQEAHEAIRPTSFKRIPEEIKSYLTSDQFKLYRLIWKRAVASQMKAAVYEKTQVNIETKGKENNLYLFRAEGEVLKFEGWEKIYPQEKKEFVLPSLEEGEILNLVKLNPEQHFTKPPPRYSEASLIKTLEANGIGRPSTYAPIISTLQDRGYVKLINKKFHPTELGKIVNNLLVNNFPKIVDVNFTAEMEENLDKIAAGKVAWVPVVEEFWDPFEKLLKEKEKELKKEEIVPIEKTTQTCPLCGGKLVIRLGRFGKFLACSKFPKCRFSKPLETDVKKLGIKCPKCQIGEVVAKKSRKGKLFYGCSRYPNCQWASWKKPED